MLFCNIITIINIVFYLFIRLKNIVTQGQGQFRKMSKHNLMFESHFTGVNPQNSHHKGVDCR